jgi:hypothetical protein
MARPVSRCRSTGQRRHKKRPRAPGPLVHKGHLDRGEDVKSRSCTHNVSTGDVFQYCSRFSSLATFAAIRRASSRVSRLAAVRLPASLSKYT